MNAVSIQGLVKVFPGGTRALDAVELAVQPGELVAVVGESGCGKSTLLRVIAGLEEATAGAVSLFGVPMVGPGVSVPAERRGVAMVFQDHALFPHLRVRDNVAFGLRGLAAAERTARVAEALELVGLPELGARYIHELSGGQRQRVALARALAPRPRILLLDEPLSSLDERLRGDLRDDIARLLRARQTTALWVTHRAEDALAVADRAVVLHQGRLLQAAPPEQIYRRPVSAYVGRMFGLINTLAADVAGRLGGPAAAAPGPVLVRPEDLLLGDAEGAAVSGTVRSRRFRGRGHLVSVELEGGALVEVASSVPPAVGAVVGLSARPGALVPTEP